ncbi:GNAT family N-acetyltransferase [Haloterrigena alkaliphila]|uniref:GNAT family N-acetyltransferase n=1 Tax=Haloterrigena alkaliphila TaxID=2816475 RepID=A0A8A2VJ55_9EURY|nr:GNAT family N-acetyltransferase [Haloterrigena alkaliphila]QSX00425.1 GNAT family N-acetyltransferase [Haloterrigena alkaliphila]
MAPQVTIREATVDDAEAISDVHAAAIREEGSEGYTDRQVEAWLANVHPERYPLEEDGFQIVVAEREGDDGDGGDPIGFGLLDCEPPDVDDDRTGQIGAVYVHPDHAREGVGTAILTDLESAAREAGLETLVLTASRNAIGFYEQRGYEGVETVSLEMSDDVALACLRMRTRLKDGPSR